MIRLTKQQVLRMHEELISVTGGSHGVPDEALLDAALSASFISFDGTDLYPALEQKVARLGYGLIENHAMIDGNKRIGAHTMLVFLALNGVPLQYTQKELYTIILEIASGKSSQEELLTWIQQHKKV